MIRVLDQKGVEYTGKFSSGGTNDHGLSSLFCESP